MAPMTMEMTLVRPAETLGPFLTGRAVAADLRTMVETELAHDGTVTIDFDGVVVMSPSFADELFAKLPRDAVEDGRVRFENLDDDLRALARFVFEGRPAAASE